MEAAAFRFTARSRQKLANLIVAHFRRVPFLMRNRALDPAGKPVRCKTVMSDLDQVLDLPEELGLGCEPI